MKNKFKIGDRVKIKEGTRKGETGTVEEIRTVTYTDNAVLCKLELDVMKEYWISSLSLKLIT